MNGVLRHPKAVDPLLLAAAKVPGSIEKQIREEAEAEVRRALDAAASAPWPDPREAYRDVQDTGGDQWR